MDRNRQYAESKIKNIIGLKFGMLTVVERLPPKNRRTIWKCLCDCGNSTTALAHVLKAKKKVSCGCHKRELIRQFLIKGHAKRLPDGHGSARIVFRNYRDHAKKVGREFCLTIEKFMELSRMPCAYCGAAPANFESAHNEPNGYTYNGIDRVDNKIGYVVHNCVPCCRQCNYAKRDLTADEFKQWIRDVYWHLCINEPTKFLRCL